MLEKLLSADAIRPRFPESFAGTISQISSTSREFSERSLTAAVNTDGDDRQTRITLSERAFSSLQESRVTFARAGKDDDAEDFSRGVDRATRRLGRALERFAGRIERLQDRAEALGERLSERIRDDIAAGRFDDRTTERAATRLLRQAGRIERVAERLTDRLGDAFERAQDKGAFGDSTLSVDFSQSISLSVQQVQIEIQDGDKSVSVSYQKLVFESTTTLGISFAESTPAVADPEDPNGASLSTAALEQGVFVNAEAAQAQAAVAQATGEGEGDDDGGDGGGEDTGAGVPQTGQPGLTAGQGALLLIQQVSFEASVSRFSFDLAARTGPFGQSEFSASAQSSRFDFSQQTTRLLSLTA